MASPTTRAEFKDYCLRKLGHPVIEINVDDDQVEDRIDEALQFFQDYHFDGVEKIFMKHKITDTDRARKWIYVPEPVIGITYVFPFDDSNSSVNMFDLRYQLRLHDLYDFTSISYVPYTMTMQHLRTLQLLFSGTPQFRFNRHLDKLFVDMDWNRNTNTGEYLVIECYRKLSPDTINFTGTMSISNTSNTVIGTGTLFDAEILIDDTITIGTEQKRVTNILTPTEMVVDSPFSTSNPSVTAYKTGISDVWNDRFLKKYATALIKRQWGSNLSKFAGIQMPGGVTLDGVRIYNEAITEIEKIEEEIQVLSVLPPEIMVG